MPGILHPGEAGRKFTFRAPKAAPPLRAFVEHYWIIHWDLRGQEPYTQRVLPYPAVNMTFKPGRCRIAGVPRGRFDETLSGAGRVFGVRFRPAGFHPFLGRPVSSITDRFLPIDAVFDRRLESVVLGTENDDEAVAAMDEYLGARAPGEPSEPARLAAEVAARIAADTGMARVDDLAREFAVSVRQLQRLFAEHVGVSPKWVIRRSRLHEAAARIADGEPVDLGALAADLGYADQAHLTRDFAVMVGTPPSQYRKAQAGP